MTKKQPDYLKRSAEAPAEMLDRSIETTQRITASIPNSALMKKSGDYWRMLGPGLTTGASDDDPSGIATYSQIGAKYGFHYLWLAAWLFPLAVVVQEMCARIGLVTGRGLAANIRSHFSKRVIYICAMALFVANVINIGADLGAMAKAAQLIRPSLNFGMMVLGFTVFSLLLQIFTPYARYAKYLKWLALVLVAYIFSAIFAHLNWQEVLHKGFVPHFGFTKDSLILICAALGTTISPYLFFWQTSQEVETQILDGKNTVVQRRTATATGDIKKMRIDVWTGMFLSQIVMFFIIATCGGILYANGIRDIQSAAQAAEALRPFAGNSTYYLFAAGIIGTGLLAIPVLATSSSYALSESMRWRQGMSHNLKQAYAFYGIIIISLIIGMGLNFLGIDPFKALIYSAFINGLVAPIILALIVIISSNKKIMGRWVNKPFTTIVGWVTTGLMAVAAVAAVYSFF
ncbi:divalent metal cation transporter [bacterium]|nr:divalent metal cation transporter [bacterium]